MGVEGGVWVRVWSRSVCGGSTHHIPCVVCSAQTIHAQHMCSIPSPPCTNPKHNTYRELPRGLLMASNTTTTRTPRNWLYTSSARTTASRASSMLVSSPIGLPSSL